MTGLLAQLKPMFVLQGLSCGLMFALMIVVLGVMVLVAASVGGTGLKLANMFSDHGKTKQQKQDKPSQQEQKMQQIQQRRADAQRRRQLAQQRLQMQRRHQ
jgi:Flp pilus assembly protein TadB